MKPIYLFLLLLITTNSFGQETNNTTIENVLERVADTLTGQTGNWKFAIEDRLLICLTDETNNRMRIISPVTELTNLPEEELLNALTANFHTALDVKYAVSDGVLWSVFIHPLKELTDPQLEDAILQVYNAAQTFGTLYSSTNLSFPGRSTTPIAPEPIKKKIQLKKG